MAESLLIDHSQPKSQRVESLCPQLEALVTGESNFVANVANISAALRQGLGYFWIGVYLVDGDSLVLGPFQGPIACTRIRRGRGVCGTAWAENRTVVVPDVEAFPGHIACSSESKSEVVVPIRTPSGDIIGVLDADSDKLDDFDESDVQLLEFSAQLIGRLFRAQ
jgi:L-methionine (R)-S-oxide reductase